MGDDVQTGYMVRGIQTCKYGEDPGETILTCGLTLLAAHGFLDKADKEADHADNNKYADNYTHAVKTFGFCKYNK